MSTDVLQENNRRYAAAFEQGGKPMPPTRRVAILTCMDARLHPERFLSCEVGDAHVIRNAGGRATEDALRSLTISSHLLGTRESLVIHHRDCGMLLCRPGRAAARVPSVGQLVAAVDVIPGPRCS